MTEQIIEVEFSLELLDFLATEGYTHILSHGTEYKQSSKGSDDYWVEPVKPGDPRITAEETRFGVNAIRDSDVIDMADGEPPIRFLCIMPMYLFPKYKSIR